MRLLLRPFIDGAAGRVSSEAWVAPRINVSIILSSLPIRPFKSSICSKFVFRLSSSLYSQGHPRSMQTAHSGRIPSHFIFLAFSSAYHVVTYRLRQASQALDTCDPVRFWPR